MSKYIDKPIRVKFQGGREGRGPSRPPLVSVRDLIVTNASDLLCVSLPASGVLKGFDPLLNLVLDGTIEYMRGKAALN